jgi:hypothetical protein
MTQMSDCANAVGLKTKRTLRLGYCPRRDMWLCSDGSRYHSTHIISKANVSSDVMRHPELTTDISVRQYVHQVDISLSCEAIYSVQNGIKPKDILMPISTPLSVMLWRPPPGDNLSCCNRKSWMRWFVERAEVATVLIERPGWDTGQG